MILARLQFHGAADSFAAALRIRPLDAKSHVNLGASLISLRRPGEAERRFRRAIELLAADPPRDAAAAASTAQRARAGSLMAQQMQAG